MPTDFTPAQLDAIEYRKLDACVVAGPGAGKTTVLVERYRRLVEDHQFDPRQILAITFTEKAAAISNPAGSPRFTASACASSAKTPSPPASIRAFRC